MLERQTAAIPDVYADNRVPVVAYRPTFVRALLMVPVREAGSSAPDDEPSAAIGIYWARCHGASDDEIRVAEGLADAAAIALARARLHAEVQEARGRAEAANRAKDEFIATVSHELRQPLTSILGWVRMLRIGNADAAQRSHGLEVIDRNAKAQIQLVEDLLDVSRMAAAKLSIRLETVELADVVEAAVDGARPIAAEKQIQLTCLVDRKAGPVSGDAERLHQVTANLLSNAIKFTPKGGRVDVRLERVSVWLELRVSDTGRGIDPAFLPQIFERFSQQAPARRHGGLGLGLTIVRHLVELHGGTVHATSAGDDQGATFTVRLPAADRPSDRVG
jgi:signal transduction histidine kinase